VQDIDVHREFDKLVVTLLVMGAFSNFLGASRACAEFRDPTAVSRFIDDRLLLAILLIFTGIPPHA